MTPAIVLAPSHFSGYFDTYNVVTGGAWDLMGNIAPGSFFSMPIYFGWYMMYYDTKGDIAPYYPVNTVTSYMTVKGRGPAYGPFLGAAIGFSLFGKVVVSLYGTINAVLGKNLIYGTVVQDNPSSGSPFQFSGLRQPLSLTIWFFASVGIRVAFRGESPLSVSFNISGLGPEIIPVYRKMYQGLEMRTYSISVSYSAL